MQSTEEKRSKQKLMMDRVAWLAHL